MGLLADAHVHIYPGFNLERLFEWANSSLRALSKNDSDLTALFFAERFDCNFFAHLKQKGNSILPAKYSLDTIEDGAVLSIFLKDSKENLLLFPGRQIVSSEKVEVLSLLCEVKIPDGKPLRECVQRILDNGALPALTWAPGKWLFKRGALVKEMVEDNSIESLFLVDTMLRFPPLSEPVLFANGRAHHRKILAGSDPLPFEGEEENIGRYGIYIGSDISVEKPRTSVRESLIRDGDSIQIVGSRSHMLKAVKRFFRNETCRRFSF